MTIRTPNIKLGNISFASGQGLTAAGNLKSANKIRFPQKTEIFLFQIFFLF